MERPPSRHLSAVGDNSRLSDDQADRDADRDRRQQTKDDEDDETEHRRRVALLVAVSFVLPTVALSAGHNVTPYTSFGGLVERPVEPCDSPSNGSRTTAFPTPLSYSRQDQEPLGRRRPS